MSESIKPALGRNNFDFLRFVLASLVVLSHSYPLATGTEDDEPLAVLTSRQLTLGSLAVDCFFIISGFLILHSWQSVPDTRAFLAKRVRRIYPGFIAAAALGAFVVTPLFSTAGAAGLDWNFVGHFIGGAARLISYEPGPAFQTNPAANTVNGSLWSIPYEFWCYIGIVACGLSGIAKRPPLLLAGLVASVLLSFAFVRFNIRLSGGVVGAVLGYPPFWARLLPYFIVGMTFHALRDRIPLRTEGAVACIGLLIVGAVLPNGLIFVLPLAAAYLLFWFAFLPIPTLSRFARHGDFSYGIYLYSFPILQIVAYVHGDKWAPWKLFAIAWPLSILAAVASWHLLERRFVHRARSRAITTPATVPYAS